MIVVLTFMKLANFHRLYNIRLLTITLYIVLQMTSVQNLNIIKQNDKDTAWEIGHADSENA